MTNIAISFCGHVRTFPALTKIFLELINNIERKFSNANIVLFFRTWDTENVDHFKCFSKKTKIITVSNLNDVKTEYAQIFKNHWGSTIHPDAFLLHNDIEQIPLAWILKYENCQEKNKFELANNIVFDLVFELRPDVIYKMGTQPKSEVILPNPFEVFAQGDFRNNFFKSFNSHSFIGDLYFISDSFTHDVICSFIFSVTRQQSVTAHQSLAMHLLRNNILQKPNNLFFTDCAIVRQHHINQIGINKFIGSDIIKLIKDIGDN